MRIGEVSGLAGVSVRSLRYYEEQGLIGAERTPSGQRRYGDDTVARVRLIQQFYAAGLPSRAIAGILPSVDSGVATSETVRILAAERRRIATTIGELQHALSQLDTVIAHADHAAADADACRYSHDAAAVQQD